MVVYRARYQATLKYNLRIKLEARWIKLLLQHAPNQNEHVVRYYGRYSNRSNRNLGKS